VSDRPERPDSLVFFFTSRSRLLVTRCLRLLLLLIVVSVVIIASSLVVPLTTASIIVGVLWIVESTRSSLPLVGCLLSESVVLVFLISRQRSRVSPRVESVPFKRWRGVVFPFH